MQGIAHGSRHWWTMDVRLAVELEERREAGLVAQRARLAEVYLVAFDGRLPFEAGVYRVPAAADGRLFLAEGGGRGQQSEPLDRGYFVVVAEEAVVYLFAHHLVAAAEAVDCAAMPVEAAYPVGEARVEQVFHVEHGALRPGQDDGVERGGLGGGGEFDDLDVGFKAKCLDVGVVGDARKFDDADAEFFSGDSMHVHGIQPALSGRSAEPDRHFPMLRSSGFRVMYGNRRRSSRKERET